MAVSRYFGLPGCGKTTTLAMLARKALLSGKYEHIFTNVHMDMPGVTYVPFDVLGKYQLDHCLVLIDEAMVECGDRDHKSFGKEKIELFVMHRHYYMDIVLFSQEASGVDKKIRSISADMFYIKKGLLLGKWVSTIYRIPYGIIWPDNNSNGENLGEIVMGYKKPPLISRLFAKRIIRDPYYGYFDSWEARELPPLPGIYQPVPGDLRLQHLLDSPLWFLYFFNKGIILLRFNRKARKARRRSERRQARRSSPSRLASAS